MRSSWLTSALQLIAACLAVLRRRFFGSGGGDSRPFVAEMLVELMRHELARPFDAPQGHPRRSGLPAPMMPALKRRVELVQGMVGGVGGLWISPRGLSPEDDVDPGRMPVVVYLHGGGYCVCSPQTHRALVAGLVAELVESGAPCRAFVPDYRLAPEHPHPAALDDALAVVRTLAVSGALPSRLVLGGDSAGGGLALATLLALRDAGDPLPAGAFLISPWVDLTLRQVGPDQMGPDTATPHDYLSREVLERFADAYRDGQDPRVPGISPLHGELAGLPPLYVQLGGDELLRGEGEALARRAQLAGVDTELEVVEGAFHVFQAFAPFLATARPALKRLARFARIRWESA